MWADYDNYRTVTTLRQVVRLRLKVRRCTNPTCSCYHQPYRPEAEGGIALPQHEFGLDVIALIGTLRYQQHRSVPEIHEQLRARKLEISQRTVSNLLDRYDELLALSLTDGQRLAELTLKQGRVILALDGLQPDVGHEVLWVLRDCLSNEVLVARSLLSASSDELSGLLREVAGALPVPIAAVISDGQQSLRKAVREALPGVVHQLCQFHYLREAARPIYEADRHAKKELKKRVRGIRPIECALEDRKDSEAEVIRGYCAAVRSALSDDGRPPLVASGLKLQARLSAIAGSLDRITGQGNEQGGEQATEQGRGGRELQRLRAILNRGLAETQSLWPDIRSAYGWVHQAACILDNPTKLDEGAL